MKDLERPGPASPQYPPPRDLLRGKTALITAAAGTGIGFAAAQRFAEEGARILISDIHERRLGEAAGRILAKTGQRPHTQLCDVTREDQIQALQAAAERVLGPLDILVNNAGLGGSANVVDMMDEQWTRVLDVTLTSVFRMSRAFLPSMYSRGSGVIVNNASVLGWRAQPQQAHYAAAKAGVMAFTRCAYQCGGAFHCHARVSGQSDYAGGVAGIVSARGFWPAGRSLGGGQCDRVPGERPFQLHDRRDRAGFQPASVSHADDIQHAERHAGAGGAVARHQ